MRKLLILSLALLTLLTPTFSLAEQWKTEGPKIAPIAGTVLADGGSIIANANFVFTLLCASSSLAVLNLEHRNAANNANLEAQIVAVAANQSFTFHPGGSGVAVPLDGERVRIVVFVGVAGTVQCSIIHDGVAF